MNILYDRVEKWGSRKSFVSIFKLLKVSNQNLTRIKIIMISLWHWNGHSFIHPFILLCDWRFEHAKHNTMHVVLKKHFSRFSSNSEANASELLENLEEMKLSSKPPSLKG